MKHKVNTDVCNLQIVYIHKKQNTSRTINDRDRRKSLNTPRTAKAMHVVENNHKKERGGGGGLGGKNTVLVFQQYAAALTNMLKAILI